MSFNLPFHHYTTLLSLSVSSHFSDFLLTPFPPSRSPPVFHQKSLLCGTHNNNKYIIIYKFYCIKCKHLVPNVIFEIITEKQMHIIYFCCLVNVT